MERKVTLPTTLEQMPSICEPSDNFSYENNIKKSYVRIPCSARQSMDSDLGKNGQIIPSTPRKWNGNAHNRDDVNVSIFVNSTPDFLYLNWTRKWIYCNSWGIWSLDNMSLYM